MHNIKNIIIASVTFAITSASLSAVAALSPTEKQCADYLNSTKTNKIPSEAQITALTYCFKNYSCADKLGGAVSDCSAKLGQWHVTQAIQAAKVPPKKIGTPSTTAASTSQAPALTPTPASTTAPTSTQIQTQEPVVTLSTTPAASETTTTTTNTNQTNTKKTDKPSINWF